ncbi:MAG: phosphate ABC transporter permease PstA [Phycisphaera sp.]|nr:phosphate ABC transporter permease PstA [Phycisphaera sp.]
MSRAATLDVAAALFAWGCAAIVTAAFAWLLIDVAWRGVGGLSWSFLVDEPSDAGRAGGVGPVVLSTLLILAVCMAVSVPLGLGAAALLAEFTRGDTRFARLVRRSLDVLAGVPSIVFGLFGNAFFCLALGMGYSILSGGLTLACMVLPILIRVTEQGMRDVPDAQRHAAAALGLSRTTTLLRVTLPAAMPALAVGLVLGVGRALAETAALIFTSGYVTRTPASLLDSGRSLSVHIYDLAMNVPGGETHASAAALLLIAVLLAINLLTNWITRRTHPGWH